VSSSTPFPHRQLAHLPTPLEPLPRLSAALGGPRIWVKRDDATGLGLGGNKARKLEYLMADALAQGCDVILTVGATQSNHCRQTAAAAARTGLDCEVLLEQRFPEWPEGYQAGGNRFLDGLFGAQVHDYPRGTDLDAAMAERARVWEADGRRPYLIPLGGSSVVGSMGYRTAAVELLRQADDLGFEPREIVHATSSGGTQAGLLAGIALRRRPVAVLGISAGAPSSHLEPIVTDLVRSLLERIGVERSITADQVVVDDGFVGEAYGVPTAAAQEAISLCARQEGLLLDPVYTGKAMAGLFDHIARGRYSTSDHVVFVHTGGAPALFAYRESVVPDDGDSVAN